MRRSYRFLVVSPVFACLLATTAYASATQATSVWPTRPVGPRSMRVFERVAQFRLGDGRTLDSRLRSSEMDGAGEVTKDEAAGSTRKPMNPFLVFLIVEGAIAANSYLATLSPDGYGGLAIVLSPVAALQCDSCNKAEAVVGAVGLAGIGAYNLTLDEHALSDDDIFWRNVVAWHVAAAALGITYLAGRHHKKKSGDSGEADDGRGGTFSVFPVPRGAAVGYTYRY